MDCLAVPGIVSVLFASSASGQNSKQTATPAALQAEMEVKYLAFQIFTYFSPDPNVAGLLSSGSEEVEKTADSILKLMGANHEPQAVPADAARRRVSEEKGRVSPPTGPSPRGSVWCTVGNLSVPLLARAWGSRRRATIWRPVRG